MLFNDYKYTRIGHRVIVPELPTWAKHVWFEEKHRKTFWKNSGRCIYFIQQRNCCNIGINHWAETNIHTEPLKQWLAQWSSKASGRLKHTRTISHGHPILSRTHTLIYIFYLTHFGCFNSSLITILSSNVFIQRRAIEGHLSFPCCLTRRCLRTQPFIIMVHLYATRPPSNNTARPAVGLESVVQGDVEVESCSGQREGREEWSHRPSWRNPSLGRASGGLRSGGGWWWATAV